MASDAADDPWIPCDLCEEVVRFSSWAAHAEACQRRAAVGPMLFALREEEEEESEEGDADADADDSGADADEDDERMFVINFEAELNTANTLIGNIISGNVSASALLAALVGADGGYEANLRLAEILGRVERGVSEPAAVAPSWEGANADDDAVCPVCQERLLAQRAEGREIVRTRACGHAFCRDCLYRWLGSNTRCPVCMLDLEPEPPRARPGEGGPEAAPEAESAPPGRARRRRRVDP